MMEHSIKESWLKLRQLPASSVLFGGYFLALSLYWIGSPVNSRMLRFMVLLGLTCGVACSSSYRRDIVNGFKALPTFVKWLCGLMGLIMVVSAAVSVLPWDIKLIGYKPEFMGLLAWLIFASLGLLFSKSLKHQLLSGSVLVVAFLSLAGSFVYNWWGIVNGLRMSGLMFQPTTFAMYALVVLIICLHHLYFAQPKWRTVLAGVTAALAAVAIALTQSRVGYVSAVLVLAVWLLRHYRQRLVVSVLLAGLIVAFGLLPRLNYQYFERFYAQSVSRGVSYRLDLYKTSARDLAAHNLVIGSGPSSLPRAINDPNQVPDEIATTLKLGYSFVSTHDLYFDLAYYFGLLVMMAFGGLSLLAAWQGWRQLHQNEVLLLIFAVLVLNALLNVPSLELTSLYIVIMFGLLAGGRYQTPADLA